jgi:hypothetical protein
MAEPTWKQQVQHVKGLQAAVYGRPDPAANLAQLRELARQTAQLRRLHKEQPAAEQAQAGTQLFGKLLGRDTTGLEVETALRMQPLPTGVYHLLDPAKDPLLRVTVKNTSRDTKRVRVKAFIEGLSTTAVKTVEIEANKSEAVDLFPALLPHRARSLNQVQRATLHVVVDHLDGRQERHDTHSLVCLARTSSFNAVFDPHTKEWVDLSHYYGAWVTPHDPRVHGRIRKAANLLAAGQIWGYQGKAADDPVTPQVRALYRSLQKADIVYINSVIDFGTPDGMATQRTRLPRESLKRKSANCIDGTVLMASLLEGASINPLLVLVPGHAFVGWQTWEGEEWEKWEEKKKWRFLETTLIGKADFEVACRSAESQYAIHMEEDPAGIRNLSVRQLRARNIWPME